VSKKEYFEGIGRRKTSTCRVRIYKGKEASTVNGMPIEEYFQSIPNAKNKIMEPLDTVELRGKYYFTAKVNGGGTTGQVDAIQLGLARALYEMDGELKPVLRQADLVTRDPRAVERKKYHRIKARKKPQFSKR
jgi:small subunit ribosomal protein S9